MYMYNYTLYIITHRVNTPCTSAVVSLLARSPTIVMDSPRYNSVLVNKTRIIESLEATKTTRKLAIKFQEKKWTGLTSNPTAEELVDNVLGRIKEDEEDFDIFVEKLKELVGLDQLVATLEKTSKDPHHHE